MRCIARALRADIWYFGTETACLEYVRRVDVIYITQVRVYDIFGPFSVFLIFLIRRAMKKG